MRHKAEQLGNTGIFRGIRGNHKSLTIVHGHMASDGAENAEMGKMLEAVKAALEAAGPDYRHSRQYSTELRQRLDSVYELSCNWMEHRAVRGAL